MNGEKKDNNKRNKRYGDNFLSRINLGIRPKLTFIFLLQNVLPIILMVVIAWSQINVLGKGLMEIAVKDSSDALNKSATENIERITTDAALKVAEFLYSRDDDLRFAAAMPKDEELYKAFLKSKTGRVVKQNTWVLSQEENKWIETGISNQAKGQGGVSTNSENDIAFNYVPPQTFEYEFIPLYNEISYIDKATMTETCKAVDNTRKKNYPLSTQKNRDLSVVNEYGMFENTYIKAESYYPALVQLEVGEIYVSDVIGAYVGTNYIKMYTEKNVKEASEKNGYEIKFDPESQAYAGEENPNGQRFEGIIRWITPVANAGGEIEGYISLALNHDHIMEIVDHITPMDERYTSLPSADEGNYAFIWDYNCRSIVHPRHHSIVGYDANTGLAAVPWLETSIYEDWQANGADKYWYDYVSTHHPEFEKQSNGKTASAKLTEEGNVGLDGRYLNNAPQCTGWMDLTLDGGSGSFNISWSGIPKLTTAAAIPYYTGQYAPSEQNNYSRRGFGFVTVGANLEDFTSAAAITGGKLTEATNDNLKDTALTFTIALAFIVILIVFIAVFVAMSITGSITGLVRGVYKFRGGERQFRFASVARDEFGALADSFDEMAESIENSVKNPLAITDINFNTIYMNKHGLLINKKELDEIVGTSYRDNSVYPKDTVYDPISALNGGREAEIFYHEDTDRYIRGQANYLTDNEGNKAGYIIETLDMTDMVRIQQALERAVEAANLANNHKGDFLARMSHEIRTPMNAIIGITNVVLKKLSENTDEAAESKQAIKSKILQIESSSQHLLGLLNDILDISKIEAGKIELSEETMDINILSDTVSTIIKPRCDDRKISYVANIDVIEPFTFRGDPLRLRQVLINLLGNAVKFTEEYGTVGLSIKKLDSKDGKSLLGFSVWDTGIGISAESMQNIFKPFEQADKNVSSKYGGTGLGLAISSNIVALFGGELKVESQIGKGSKFSFEIWLPETELDVCALEESVDTVGKFKGKRILLVDDVEINRMVVSSLLEDTGLQIDEADDGLTAVEKFSKSAIGTYNLIFMDIKMPNLDGYGAASRIRELERTDAKTIPIIALTANAFKEDIENALKYGMNAHIAKPIEPDALMRTLFKYLSD